MGNPEIPMTAERWRRMEDLFDRAADLPDIEQQAFLEQECGNDTELREAMIRLLSHDRSRGEKIADVIEGVSRIPAPAESNFTGRRLGPYRVVREIGRGGMGIVFEAVRDDDQFQKRVALKVAARAAFSPELLQRFRHERQVLAQLEHPHIARLLDGGTTEEEIPFFAMEYVEGVPVHQYAVKEGISIPARLRIFLQVCDAVEYAHQNLVIHRDLKPENILVADGSVRLLDFGIAKLLDTGDSAKTQSGMTPLTPHYCSPEQVRGQPVTTRTDVYGLGLVLYELLTGERAQEADTSSPRMLDHSICEKAVSAPSASAQARGDQALVKSLRGDLDTVVLTAIQKDPARRYPSVAALAEDIRRYLESKPIRARQDSHWYRAGKFVRRQWIPLTASMLLLVTLVAGIVMTTWQARRAERRFQQVRRIANALMNDVNDAIRDLPASTKAQEVVVRTAVEYLDGLAREAANDQALQLEIAQGYTQVAALEFSMSRPSLSRPEDARRSLEKARSILDARYQAHPNDLLVATATAGLYVAIFNFLYDTGKHDEALKMIKRAIQIGEAAVTQYPSDVKLLDTFVESQMLLISGYSGSSEAPNRVPRYLEYAERLAKLQPVSVSSLAMLGVAYAQAGKVAQDGADEEQALRYYERNAELQARVVELEPGNSTGRRNLMLAWSHIAGINLGPLGPGSYTGAGGPAVPIDPKKRAKALEAMKKAVELAEWRYQRDPKDDNVKFDYAMSLGRQAPAFPPGDARAIGVLEKSLELFRQIEPTYLERTLGFVLEFRGSLAERYRQMGQFSRAVAEWNTIDALVNRAVAADPKAYLPYRLAIPAFENWAMELARRGDRTGALAMAKKVEDVAKELGARESLYARAAGWPPRVLGWKARLCEMLDDERCAAMARQQSVEMWRSVASRADLPMDLVKEARAEAAR
jgi:serine/threonine protein kinase/tetratricopeptide (TPR) repeat protein